MNLPRDHRFRKAGRLGGRATRSSSYTEVPANDSRNRLRTATSISQSALVNFMKSNEIDVFDINDGKLVYAKTKVKAPINKTTLFAALMQHYKDEDAAKKLSEFILDSRQEKIKESIRRKIQK